MNSMVDASQARLDAEAALAQARPQGRKPFAEVNEQSFPKAGAAATKQPPRSAAHAKPPAADQTQGKRRKEDAGKENRGRGSLWQPICHFGMM